MQRHKITVMLLALMMSFSFCGCDMDQLTNKVREELNDRLWTLEETVVGALSGVFGLSGTRVTAEHMDFAEQCFTDIEVFGAKLALPMNVSDLPADFTLEEDDLMRQYDGIRITSANLLCDGKEVADVEVMHPQNGTFAEGQIVTMTFNSGLAWPGTEVKLGGEHGYFTMERANELLGECEENYYLLYELGDGRIIRLWYLYYQNLSVEQPQNAYCITLSAVGKTMEAGW